jgi:hypothetical protein
LGWFAHDRKSGGRRGRTPCNYKKIPRLTAPVACLRPAHGSDLFGAWATAGGESCAGWFSWQPWTLLRKTAPSSMTMPRVSMSPVTLPVLEIWTRSPLSVPITSPWMMISWASISADFRGDVRVGTDNETPIGNANFSFELAIQVEIPLTGDFSRFLRLRDWQSSGRVGMPFLKRRK